MYNSRNSGWGGSRGQGRKKSPSSVNKDEGDQALPVIGAVITSIEAHAKKPHMYRILMALELDPSFKEHEPAGEAPEEGLVWHAEVDDLIARAKSLAHEHEALITVHEDTLVSWRLLKGRQLTAEEYLTLRADEQKEEAYKSSLSLLERKARTATELARALKRKGYTPEVVEGCLERLRKQRMVDDSAYAKRFTEQRAVGQRKGRMLIRQELLHRGVSREDVEGAINELDSQVEYDSALLLARKRWSLIKGENRERIRKLMGLLLRRGFPSGIVRAVIQQVAVDSIEDDVMETDYEEEGPLDSEFS